MDIRKFTWACSECNYVGSHYWFNEWVIDLKVGIIGDCKCNRCRGSKPLDYERRNRFLKTLGYNSYYHYLNSEMWKTIRKVVLDRDGGRCVVPGCGKPATDVHHNSYELNVLIGNDTSQLSSLCRYHHKDIEFFGYEKRTFLGARHDLMCKGVELPEFSRNYENSISLEGAMTDLDIWKMNRHNAIERLRGQAQSTANQNKRDRIEGQIAIYEREVSHPAYWPWGRDGKIGDSDRKDEIAKYGPKPTIPNRPPKLSKLKKNLRRRIRVLAEIEKSASLKETERMRKKISNLEDEISSMEEHEQCHKPNGQPSPINQECLCLKLST